MKLYQELAADLTSLIRQGTLQAGERIPSVRELCRERGVSPATAMRAYDVLEANGLVESRHRSGYYVSNRWQQASERAARVAAVVTLDASRCQRSGLQHSRSIARSRCRAVGIGISAVRRCFLGEVLPDISAAARSNAGPVSTVESLPPGSPELRRQIARRYLQFGSRVPADEIVVTSGALEALTLCLQTVTRPGDTVAIEAPAFYACLQAIETWGLRAVEIPTHPREGVDLGALEQAISKHNVRACWFMTTLSESARCVAA